MNKKVRLTLFSSLILSLMACVPTKKEHVLDSKKKAKADSFILMIKENTGEALSSHEVEGIEFLYKGNYQKASEKFSLALSFAPQSGSAHFLNALTYHLMAKDGNTSKAELAEVGYGLAKNFSPDNVYASYYHGILNFENKKFLESQQNFADALILKPNDPKILYALSVASYYAHDLQGAAGAISQAVRLNPKSAKYLHAAALIMAAEGKEQEAQEYKNKLVQVGASKGQLEFLSKRINDWKQFHKNLLKKASWHIENIRPSQKEASDKAAEDVNHENDMIIVDVVIILATEQIVNSQGINILTQLSLMFGAPNLTTIDGASTPGLQHTRTIGNFGSVTKNIVTNVTIPAITYSLNIANISGSHTEILARPSLVARHGKMSKFFSGDNLTFGLAGSAGGMPSYRDKKIGVDLQVTPQFLGDGQVNLQITASRNFFTPTNTLAANGFENSVQVSDTEITSDVILNMGDTLILGGLSEKQNQSSSNSVPILGDIPFIQGIFSNKGLTQINRSVIILVTPRFPAYTYQTKKTKEKNSRLRDGDDKPSNLDELKARYIDWFKPYPNLASAFHQIDRHNLYREFRTGDVQLEKWNHMEDVMDKIQSSMDFMYQESSSGG